MLRGTSSEKSKRSQGAVKRHDQQGRKGSLISIINTSFSLGETSPHGRLSRSLGKLGDPQFVFSLTKNARSVDVEFSRLFA